MTRVAGLETRIEVAIISGPETTVMADPDQLEQMLINLVRNAAEAVLEGSPAPKSRMNRNPLHRTGSNPELSSAGTCRKKLWS